MTADPVAEAVRILAAGGLVAFPTETVYGLGADATDGDAVRRLFAVKGRPADHPLIVHLGTDEDPRDGWVGEWPAVAAELAARFWPGPLTLVLPRGARVAAEVTGGRATVGVRVPDHALALELLDRFGRGVAAPSANRFGRVSPTTAAHVAEELAGDVELVLDGGPAAIGVESTIVDLTGPAPTVLRPGGLATAELATVLGSPPAPDRGPARAPGMLARHYAPSAPLVVVEPEAVARAVAPGTVVLGPVGTVVPGGVRLVVTPEDPAAYARNLYARIRDAETDAPSRIVVVRPAGEGGLWEAIADRLRRASHE